MLNTNQYYWSNPVQFWNDFNIPWLNGLKNSSADVVVLRDKSNGMLKYKWTKNEFTKVIEYEINQITEQRILTGFGKEVEYMEN